MTFDGHSGDLKIAPTWVCIKKRPRERLFLFPGDELLRLVFTRRRPARWRTAYSWATFMATPLPRRMYVPEGSPFNTSSIEFAFRASLTWRPDRSNTCTRPERMRSAEQPPSSTACAMSVVMKKNSFHWSAAL